MKFLFYCDHKWRDLPALVAIKIYLEKYGHRVFISPARGATALIPVFKPDAIVLNHFWSTEYKNLASELKTAGVAIFILSTEGGGRPIFFTMQRGDSTDFSAIDRLYNWGTPVTENMIAREAVRPDQVRTSGCPRIDFYREPLSGAVKPRVAVAREYGFDPERPIITWATQFPHAELGASGNEAQWNRYCAQMTDTGADRCFAAMDVDYRDFPRYQAELRTVSTRYFFELAKRNPQFQFIVKQHPNENRAYYSEQIDEYGLSNVRFCRADYIWNILNASDMLLHRHCTTAVEAWLWGKPTIELAAVPGEILAWPEREAGSVTVEDFDALHDAVGAFVAGRPIAPDMLRARAAYIETWFGVDDGRRCAAIAEDMDVVMRARGASARPAVRHLGTASWRLKIGVLAQRALSLRPGESLLRGVGLALRALFSARLRREMAESKYATRRDERHYRRKLALLLSAR